MLKAIVASATYSPLIYLMEVTISFIIENDCGRNETFCSLTTTGTMGKTAVRVTAQGMTISVRSIEFTTCKTYQNYQNVHPFVACILYQNCGKFCT